MADTGSDQPGLVDEANEKEKASQKRIETAVKFLQNPRVQETPLSQCKAFLAKKGLSPEEISQAIKQSGTDEQIVEAGIPPSRKPYQSQSISTVNHAPYSARWRDYFMVAVIGGSFGYALVHLVKTYILPYFLEQKNDNQEKMDQLQSSVSELKENLSQTVGGIQDTLDSVQKLLQDQQQKVQTLSLSLSTPQSSLTQSLTDSYSLSEVKSELTSLKGLLLSRRQFPSPVVQSSPLPSIPVWQRNEAQVSVTAASTNTAENGGGQEASHSSAELKPAPNGAVTISQHASDTSSGTLELQETHDADTGFKDGDESCPDQSDTSFSTLSSDGGSPNLSFSEMKEGLSETYVTVPTDR